MRNWHREALQTKNHLADLGNCQEQAPMIHRVSGFCQNIWLSGNIIGDGRIKGQLHMEENRHCDLNCSSSAIIVIKLKHECVCVCTFSSESESEVGYLNQ